MANKSQDIAIFKNDIYFIDGDFGISESDEQHVSDTISAFPGWWKQNPADGVGILQYLNSSGQEQTLSRSMKIQLSSDGYSVGNTGISIVNGHLTVNPDATKL
jgi:hypothetical protein